MSFKPIIYKSKPLTLHKAIVQPDFDSKSVFVTDTWEYVEMWLKNEKKTEALYYWKQAKNFYYASRQLPKTSSPLTAYYCFLNATKALLTSKNITLTSNETHGVTGETEYEKNVFLTKETVKFLSKQKGILYKLCEYLGESCNDQYNLSDLLYNLPYIHRAYNLTYKSSDELFIPISEPVFVKKDDSSESWFCATIEDNKYINDNLLKILPKKFEKDNGVKERYCVRMKDRFKWDINGSDQKNLEEIKKYHLKIRNYLYSIYAPTRLWYIKCSYSNKKHTSKKIIERSSLTITFAIMHKLSEFVRYSPKVLYKHLENKRHNWLLSEFIYTSLYQFIDEISSEITGKDFMLPGRAIRE